MNAIDSYDRTGLIAAIEGGRQEVLDLFFSMSELNVNRKTNSGYTALMSACAVGNVSAVSSLLARGASVNEKEREDGWPALFFAVAHKHSEAAVLLLECPDIDIQAVDSYGQSVLHLAASEGCIDLLRLFLQKGVDVFWEDVEGNKALAVAESEEARELLKHAEAVSERDHEEDEKEEEEGERTPLV